jgi:hypothetical protein
MLTSNFEAFSQAARAAGFDDVLERHWPPGTVVPEHSHPFDAEARVSAGEMWLTCAGETRHLLPGDTFSISHGVRHAERYGAQGASYWVARRTV